MLQRYETNCIEQTRRSSHEGHNHITVIGYLPICSGLVETLQCNVSTTGNRSFHGFIYISLFSARGIAISTCAVLSFSCDAEEKRCAVLPFSRVAEEKRCAVLSFSCDDEEKRCAILPFSCDDEGKRCAVLPFSRDNEGKREDSAVLR